MILLEIYASTRDATINGTMSTKHKVVCLISSVFTFEFLFSLINVLYNFKALTFNIKIIGITIIFCKNNDGSENSIAFPWA